MPVSVWESIASTPWWVYALYGVIIYFCLKARHPSRVNLKQLLILPLYLLTLTAFCAAVSMHPTLKQISAGALASTIGAAFGWMQFARTAPGVDPINRRLTVPGSNIPLLLLIAATIAKFAFHVSFNLNLELLNTGIYNTPLFALYGFITGLNIGRYAFAHQAIKRAAA